MANIVIDIVYSSKPSWFPLKKSKDFETATKYGLRDIHVKKVKEIQFDQRFSNYM